MTAREPEIVLEQLRGLPGGAALLDVAAGREDVELVGGAVRDLLLGRRPRELDVVVGGADASFTDDAALFAEQLLARLEAETAVSEHERFGTMRVEWDGGRIDIATRRAESYPAPGVLPEVRAGTPEEDLRRRDFTVNAIGVTLNCERPGEVLRTAPGALEDLRAGRLRVLHERSFIDDPTRLLRLARYAARLDFELEEHTAALAETALAARALDTVSGARIGAELRLALGESDGIAALAALSELGVLAALHPRLRFDDRLARTALEMLSVADLGEGGARPDLLLLAALLQPMACGLEEGVEQDMHALLDDLEFPAGDRDVAIQDAICADAVAEELTEAETPSEIYEAASHLSLEGVALGGAWGDLRWGVLSEAGFAARQWLAALRKVRLTITGEDLLAAGIPESPEIGRRLATVLKLRLDGQLADGREAELKAALERA
jgi:tRNA nucleotidyltransferase (CCA-adding enzyme)